MVLLADVLTSLSLSTAALLVVMDVPVFVLLLVGFAAGAACGYVCGLLRGVARGSRPELRGLVIRQTPDAPTDYPYIPRSDEAPAKDWTDPRNAPPAFPGMPVHPYEQAEATPCCKLCGGGSLDPVHAGKPDLSTVVDRGV